MCKKIRGILVVILLVLLAVSRIGLSVVQGPIRITVVYDNYTLAEGVRADWGFACLIEGMGKTILFDTGTYGNILLDNMKALGVSPQDAHVVVISHNHADHTGGLPSVLGQNHDVTVYVPTSFSQEQIRDVERTGADAIVVNEPIQICEGVGLTKPLGTSIIEQSLLLYTPKGLVVVTGCSHPGIVPILEKAKEIGQKGIYFVFGGFHLDGYPTTQVDGIIRQFRQLGVQKVGASHCTGDQIIQQFREAYGMDFVPIGVGRIEIAPDVDLNEDGVVSLPDLACLANTWRTRPGDPNGRPESDLGPALFGDGAVGPADLAVLTEHWLACPGLLAHWRLDEETGEIAHDSVHAREGQLHGHPAWQPAGGRLGGALALDGVDDYVQTDFIRDPSKGAFTVFAWVKGGAQGGVILSQGNSANWLSVGVQGSLRTDLKGSDRWAKPLESTALVTDGQWHRVGLARDGTDRILYCDDVEVARDTQTALTGSNTGLRIGAGARLEPGVFWSGLIDDVRIYDRMVRP